MKTKIDYEGLKSYLLTLKHWHFETENQMNFVSGIARIEKGIHQEKVDNVKVFADTPASRIIRYGEPFLVDALGGELSICWATKRLFKLPYKRKIHAKFDRIIIENTREVFGKNLAGVWKIPKDFLTEIKP